MILLLVVLGLLGVERLFELYLSRGHQAQLIERGGTLVEADGFLLILVVHVGLFPALLVEHALAPWSGAWIGTWPLLGAALAAQGVRYWCIWTLGDRWTTRVVVVPGEDRIQGGPYRWLEHPNYLAVVVELLAIPAAFGLWASAIALSVLNVVALRRRVHVEVAALRAAEAGA